MIFLLLKTLRMSKGSHKTPFVFTPNFWHVKDQLYYLWYLSSWHKEMVTGTSTIFCSLGLKHTSQCLFMFYCLPTIIETKMTLKFCPRNSGHNWGGGRPRWKVITLFSVFFNPFLREAVIRTNILLF